MSPSVMTPAHDQQGQREQRSRLAAEHSDGEHDADRGGPDLDCHRCVRAHDHRFLEQQPPRPARP